MGHSLVLPRIPVPSSVLYQLSTSLASCSSLSPTFSFLLWSQYLLTWYFTWIPGNVVRSCPCCYWDIRCYLPYHLWTDRTSPSPSRDIPSPAQSSVSASSVLACPWLMIALFKLALCPCHFSILGPLRRGTSVQLLAGLRLGVHLSVCAHASFSASPKIFP